MMSHSSTDEEFDGQTTVGIGYYGIVDQMRPLPGASVPSYVSVPESTEAGTGTSL